MQSPISIIAKKELASFFDSLTAYIMLVAFLGFSGFFTWIFGSDVFIRKEAEGLFAPCFTFSRSPAESFQ